MQIFDSNKSQNESTLPLLYILIFWKWQPSKVLNSFREFVYNDDFILHLSTMRKNILQILSLVVYLLINYKLLKITIFPFKSTVFTFLIFTILALQQSYRVPT